MYPQSAREFYRGQQRLAVALMGLTRREWAAMGTDFDRSWLKVGPRLVLLTGSAQLGAARAGALYIPKVLAETNQVADADGLVNAYSIAGTAADGRTLDGLLYGAVTVAKQAKQGLVITDGNVTTYTAGASTQDALQAGGSWLDMVVHSVVSDAGRIAASLAMVARPRVTGYVRMLNPPSCNRCAVLAGKWFKWNAGFRRHPRCDCVHIPASENRSGDFRTDPRAAIEAGQVTGLSAAQTRAIVEDGADVGQVINATRGMEYARVFGQNLQITLEGTTKRGLAGKRLLEQFKAPGSRFAKSSNAATRLTPESIYQVAGSRANAIRLLKQYGYLL